MFELRRAVAGLTACALAAIFAASPAAATTDPNDGQWYIGPYQIQEFHAQGIDGSGVTVAVVDNAINLDVPQLQGADIQVKEPSLCYGPGGVEQPATSDDPAAASHGTNVTSYIVGNGTGYDGQPGITGIAPKAKILFYSIRTDEDCVSATGETSQARASDEMLSSAIVDATDSGADIINFSNDASTANITDALIYAYRHHVIIVAALNNQETKDMNESIDGYPAVSNGVIGVGSFGPGGDVMLDGFGYANVSSWVDVVAPGVQMLIQGTMSSWTDYVVSRGNSFATPIVSGNLALAIQKYPNATHDQIIQSLIHNTGTEAHELGWDSKYGYGAVDTITLLSTDPTQYEDVNPLLNKNEESNFLGGPSFDEVYGAAPTASPSPTASAPTDVTAAPVDPGPGPGEDTGSPAWLLLALVGGGLVFILIVVAIIVVAVKLSNKKAGPQA